MESALAAEAVPGSGGLLLVVIIINIVRPVLSRSHHKKAQHYKGPIVLSLT